jgi:hypothetical protein
MHIYVTWSSVLNISSVCVRVTWIRWLRSMLCKLDFHQVLDLDHHITFYNIYDQRWVSFSYGRDDLQGKFSICMKKFEKRSPDREGRGLGENGELRGQRLGQNEVCAFSLLDKSSSYDHRWVSFLYEHDDMQEKFSICMKKSENGFLRLNWMMNFHQVFDLDSSFSSSSRPPDQRTVFGFFHTDGKFFLQVIRSIRKWHSTMVVGIIESDVVVEIENLMKIKLAKHASQSSDPRYLYVYTWNIEYWWSDEVYMYESILLLNFQANKWWFWGVNWYGTYSDGLVP